ncbi:hypothetical protein SHAb15599_00023 [Acinetobacter phage SH-Ab 15599]|nr:hypothetical protein SHAb15599_00023 [Acinetobacter phage SH-Ab 15599]
MISLDTFQAQVLLSIARCSDVNKKGIRMDDLASKEDIETKDYGSARVAKMVGCNYTVLTETINFLQQEGYINSVERRNGKVLMMFTDKGYKMIKEMVAAA